MGCVGDNKARKQVLGGRRLDSPMQKDQAREDQYPNPTSKSRHQNMGAQDSATAVIVFGAQILMMDYRIDAYMALHEIALVR